MPEEIQGTFVSDNYMSALGGSTRIGRFFAPEENRVAGRDAVVVLSHHFWQRRFARDPQIVGQTVLLNGKPFTIISVTAPDFVGLRMEMPDIWLPLMMRAAMATVYFEEVAATKRDWFGQQDFQWLSLHGRLKPGQTLESAQAELRLLQGQLPRPAASGPEDLISLAPISNDQTCAALLTLGRAGGLQQPGTRTPLFPGRRLMILCRGTRAQALTSFHTGERLMETLSQDLRTGLRMLVKSPGFTAVAVITLALGIGANSAIFSVVNAVLLRPFQYRESDRLVFLNHNYPKINLKASVSAYGYTHYRENAESFDDIAALTGWPANLTGEGEPERLNAMVVTASFFPTLGAEAAQGRVLLPGEDTPDNNHVIVLSHAFWQRRFGGDPKILDRTITLNGESYSVVGVMPPEFQFGREVGQIIDLWRPIAFTPQQLTPQNLTNEFLTVVARLKPNVSFGQAQAEMDTIAAHLREEYMPGMDSSNWGVTLQPFRELIVGEIRPALLLVMGIVALVLLIACVNVANLLLARSAVRRKEIAVRAALGAGRLRIVRQLLTESALLALLGGGVGLIVGYWGVKALVAMNESKIPRSNEITLDYRVLGFTLLVSLVTGVVFGLLPALQAARLDLNQTLKEGGRSGAGGVRYGIRGPLVVFEVAIALVVLAAAGLFLRSFAKLQQVNPGFQPQNVITMQVSLPDFKYGEAAQRDQFFRQTLEQIEALPGVESTGAVSILPMSGMNSSGSFQIEGREVAQGESSPHGDRWSATSNYFTTMKVPLIRGRFFDERDTADSPGVAILDETMAKKYWGSEDPIGKRIVFEGTRDNPRWREIVGIVGHVKHKGLEGESRVQYYIPFTQRALPNMFLVARTSGEPAGAASAIRGVIRSIDQDLPVFRVSTMEQMVADSTAQRRFSIVLLGVFAAVALLLAAVGLYGVMGYSVNQRTQEIGVRMALGAGRGDVLRLVTRQGMALTGVGLAIGLGASLALTHLIADLLFAVSAYDPLVFAAIPFLLAGVALAACYVPACRASKVDPITALRYE